MCEDRRKAREQKEKKKRSKGEQILFWGETTRGNEEVASQKRRSERWDRGEERRGEQVPWQQLLRRGADGARRSGYGRHAWSPCTTPGRPERVTHIVHTQTHSQLSYSFILAFFDVLFLFLSVHLPFSLSSLS